MSDMMAAYERLTERFVEWAQREDEIRGAVVIGSRARTDHPADEWSDLDILLYTTDPERYRGNDAWFRPIGEAWLSFEEPTPDGQGFERRVLFAGGLDVDFVPLPTGHLRDMAERGIPQDAADLFLRGVRILVDKDGLLARAIRHDVAAPAYVPPNETVYLNSVSDFWYHTVWTAKHLRRGELWWAKSCCDGYLKNLLHRMLEWRALSATMDLYHRLSTETAGLLGFGYPTDGARHAAELVKNLYGERP
ncbi:MAG: aminoglycoside 6-adenylyltransferase [Spirochaetota bacterium]